MSGFPNRLQRRQVLACCAAVSAAVVAFAGDIAPDAVLGKLRPILAADVSDLRGIACLESSERTRYAPRRAGGTCGELTAAAANTARGAAMWHSRLRLDVTSDAARENFALTDARPLEHGDVDDILRAANSGSGEFSTFLREVISGEGAIFQAPASSGSLEAFGFAVPESKSQFQYASAHAGYQGSLYVIPQTGELRRLTLEADDVGDACRVQYSTDYSPTRVGSREVILPQSSTMEVLYKNGTELRSETYYSGCRRPEAGAAAEIAAETLKPLPAGVRLRIRFEPPIATQTAATGDPVVGVIRASVKDKTGIIVHAGDRVHGRIALIEQNMSPGPQWNLVIAMETIERGVGAHGIDQGVEQTVTLVPVDDSYTTALFDPKFVSEWETR